jgi:[acyl-carrier-protein] S-malonyltransferase
MGKELYDEYRIVQEYFEEASSCSNVNFVKLCFASSDVDLSKLANAYMSLFLVGSSVFALLKEQGITPDIVTGYNNGEMTALFAGGCFSLPDGLYLLNKFCTFFEETLDQMDVTVLHVLGKTKKELEDSIDKIGKKKEISFAFYDGEKDFIVVGLSDAISALHGALESDEMVTLDYLASESGLHSHFMKDVIEQFKIYLEKVDFKDLTIPMISGIDGAEVVKGEDIKERFVRHFTSPVKFDAVLAALKDYDLIIVATPALRMGKIIKEYYPEKNIVTIEKKADIEALKEMVHVTDNITE